MSEVVEESQSEDQAAEGKPKAAIAMRDELTGNQEYPFAL